MNNKIFSILVIFIFTFFFLSVYSQEKQNEKATLTILIKEVKTNTPLEFVFVEAKTGNKMYRKTSDLTGKTIFHNIPKGKYDINLRLMGYENLKREINLQHNDTIFCFMQQGAILLDELFVTGRESKGIVTSTKIDRKAIEHIQPSSFADILELIPGGYAKTPQYGSLNIITLRESTRPSFRGQYDTPSLGTAFVIDGMQLNTDANMQVMTGYDTRYQEGLNSVNKGVDMRAISTDDIEHVVITRGVPSVEFGELTSGLIQISRRKGATPFNFRLKTDFRSKLLALTKGVDLKKDIKLNFSIDYLGANPNARTTIYSYDRITTSARAEKKWETKDYIAILNTNLDYSKTLDKASKDVDADPTINYKSGKEKYSFFTRFDLKSKKNLFFKALNLTASVTHEYQFDQKEMVGYTSMWNTRFLIIDNTEPGDYDAEILGEHQRVHTKTVIGKPFYANAKAISRFSYTKSPFTYKLNIGSDWIFSKNYGKGEFYERDTPPFSGFRYRAFSEVPARNTLSFFAENHLIIPYRENRFQFTAGCRTFALLNMGENYALNNKFNFDPRINAQWILPGLTIGEHKFVTTLTYGIGWQSKAPTMAQLYPSNSYHDYAMFRFFADSYKVDDKLNRYFYRTYVFDRANYALKVAQNIKKDFRIDFDYNKFALSINWFREDLPGGFRIMGKYNPVEFKSYELIQGHDYKQYEKLGKIDIEKFPYRNVKTFSVYSSYENGSRTKKKGYEYTFHTPRIKAIATRLTINGARFETKYENSALWWDIAQSSSSSNIEELYIGLYKDDDSYRNTRSNTNFTFDTHLGKLGLIFTQSYQFHWNEDTYRTPKSQFPEYFMTFDDRTLLPWNEENLAKHPYAIRLTRKMPLIIDRHEKWHLIVNLKVTKKLLQDKLTCSAFVNGLLDYFPRDYEDRFGANPYFGMELSLSL